MGVSVLCACALLSACGAGKDEAGGPGVGAPVGGVGSGAAGTAGTDDFANSSGKPSTTTGGPVGSPNCAEADVNTSRLIPTVHIVVDGSGSMVDPYGGGTKWDALRDALVDPSMGVVAPLQDSVRFGMTVFQSIMMADWNPGEPLPMLGCPILTGPDAALHNYEPIRDAITPLTPVGGTPTAEAMAAVVAKLQAAGAAPDSDVGVQIILLVTDGEPNGCGAISITDPAQLMMCIMTGPIPLPVPDPDCLIRLLTEIGNQGTLKAALDAQAKGIDTYVLSLAPAQDVDYAAHLQKVANVGRGLAEDAAPPAPVYAPADPAALRDALQEIVGGALTCQVRLKGTLDVARACDPRGIVQLNGADLACDGPDGWRAIDATTIELVGASCDQWLTDDQAQLHVRFPCDVIRPI